VSIKYGRSRIGGALRVDVSGAKCIYNLKGVLLDKVGVPLERKEMSKP